jgi:hypothetical protein
MEIIKEIREDMERGIDKSGWCADVIFERKED